MLLAALAVWAWRHGKAALVDVPLLRERSVRAATVSLTFLGGVLFVGAFLLPLLFQNVQGSTVLQAGLLLIPAMTTAYTDTAPSDMGQASALTRITQQLGGAFATALVAVILDAGIAADDAAAAFDAAFWWSNGITVLAAVSALLLPGRVRSAKR